MKKTDSINIVLTVILIAVILSSCGFDRLKGYRSEAGSTQAVTETEAGPTQTEPDTAGSTVTEKASETQAASEKISVTVSTTRAKGYKVNITGLKKLASDNSFDVLMEKAEITENYFNGYSYEGNDVVAFTVKNNSGKEIDGLEIYACAYDDENCYVEMKNSAVISFFPDNKITCQVITWEDLSLAPGETQTVILRIRNGELLSGIQAIVSSYTGSDGVKTENPAAENWKSVMAAE